VAQRFFTLILLAFCAGIAVEGVYMSKTFQEVRESVRRTLQDTDGNYWSDDELNDYIDEGQLEFVRHTAALRGEAPITVKENQDAYTLPEDCIEILRVEDSEGNALVPTTSNDLQRRCGNFRNRTSTTGGKPEWYYSDLDGEGTIRFYPRPNPSIEEGEITFGSNGFQLIAYTGNGGPSFDLIQVYDEIWALTYGKLHTFSFLGNDLIQISELQHSLFPVPEWIRFSPQRPNSSQASVVIYLDTDGDLFKAADQYTAPSSFGTPSSQPRSISFIDDVYTVPRVYYVTAGGDIVYTSVASFSESTLLLGGITLGNQWYYDSVSQKHYTATVGGGLIEIDPNKATPTYTQVDATDCYGVTGLSDGTIYVTQGDGSLKKLVSGSLETVLSSGLYASPRGDYSSNIYCALQSDGANIFALDSTGDAVSVITGDAVVDSIPIYENALRDGLQSAFAKNGILYIHGDSTRVQGGIYSSFSEYGCINTIDSIVNSDESGAVIDFLSSQNDDIISFLSESGSVISISQSSVGAHVYYIRKPVIGEVQVDPLALEYYALYRAYEKDADQSNFGKGQYYLGKFWNIVSREKRKAAYGFNRSTEPSKGEYF